MTSTLSEPTRMTFTAEHLRTLAEAGYFDPNDRVELIDGEIYVTPPPGPEHANVSDRLHEHLQAAITPGHYVRPEATVELPAGNLVTVDLCVRDIAASAYDGYPPVEHLILLVEIAKTSQKMDRGEKLRSYAQAGVPEYWVIDIPQQIVEIHTLPSGDLYRRTEVCRVGDVIPHIPGTSAPLSVADLFPASIE